MVIPVGSYVRYFHWKILLNNYSPLALFKMDIYGIGTIKVSIIERCPS